MRRIQTLLPLLLLAFSAPAWSQEGKPAFLFLGSYHMNNHHRDMFNVDASDVLAPAKQRDILAVVRALEAYRPTKIMIERDTADQAAVDADMRDTCHGRREATREEYEQIGYRLACRLHVPVVAVNYNALGPIDDEKKIDLGTANPDDWKRVQALGDADARDLQARVSTSGIGDLLAYLNSDAKTRDTASRYYLIGQLRSPTERVGANWAQYWYGRNLVIFDNILDNTADGDRVLVIYGYGHGYILRRMAEESGRFDVVDTGAFLRDNLPADPAAVAPDQGARHD
ncbi:MAG: DUF5694 domain-containing protein [Luteimonas sp.]